MRFWFLILVFGIFASSCSLFEDISHLSVEDQGVDAGLEDMPHNLDFGADMETPPVCVDPEDEMSACERFGIECGSVVIMDQCIGLRAINCGGCDGGETCLAAGVCDDPGVDDPTFCATNRFCGGVDRDGRLVDCGETCAPPETCGGVLANRCGCQGESSAEYCASEGLSCGQYQFIDSCGVTRVTDCPSCVAPQTCGGGGQAGVCGCTPQSDAQICAGLNKNCDNLTNITDNCGVTRPVVNCGMCTTPQTCGGGTNGASGVQNVCGGEGCTPANTEQFCQNLGKNCGQVSGTDNCNAMRTENCGDCTGLQTCGGGNIPNVCGCTPENDADFCDRLQAECGNFAGLDNCGTFRTPDCGDCMGAEECRPTNPPHCCAPGFVCQ